MDNAIDSNNSPDDLNAQAQKESDDALVDIEREERRIEGRDLLAGVDEDKAIHPLVAGFNRLSLPKQIGVIGGIAFSIALSIALLMWSGDATYSPLIHRLQDHNAQEIVEILQRENIDFHIEPNSQVLMVRSTEVLDARMKLAAASLIDDKTVGLEVLENDSSLGTSNFIENARYRRGLEGELARTIASVKSIRNARVHLAIPKQSVFVRDARKPRASVFLEVYTGQSLSQEQVEAVVNLVASSVSEMSREDVSVVDQYSNLLSKITENEQDILANKQLQYTEKLEESVRIAVNNILQPVLGKQNYKAEVSADVDFTVVEQTEELFDPDLIALRSEQLVNEENTQKIDGGIPGALSNQPPPDANAPEQVGGEGGAGGAPVSKRSESTRNYEVDRSLSYRQQQVGKLKRLTVAVAVNDRFVVDADGNRVSQPWSEADLIRLETLVKDAVGFNAARGDSVNVVNSSFMGNAEDPLGEPDFWTQPWFWDVIKQVMAGLFVLIMIFGVIRPALKSISRKPEDDDIISLDELEDSEAGLVDEGMSIHEDDLLLPGSSERIDRQLDVIRTLIDEDSARVAQVVIKWLEEEQGN